MLYLGPDRIDLWFAFPGEVRTKGLLDRYRSLLSEDEQRQHARFFFGADRNRYLVTRALVRTVLSKYVSMEPRDWLFTADRYQRPRIANSAAPRIDFNISHTRSLIVLAITSGRAVGVDAEDVTDRPSLIELADQFFSRDEVAALRALPSQMHCERFFSCWTLKESYLKARGVGLQIPLDRFGFCFETQGRIGMWTHPELNDDAARWQYWQIQPSKEHLAALCTERSEGTTPGLTMTNIVPLEAEQRVSYDLLRSS